MKRVHVLEFEDLGWFPAWLRIPMTNLLVVFGRVYGVVPVLAALVARVLEQQGLDQIVDLGSGSGGTMPDVLAHLRRRPAAGHVSLTMTDRYPNRDAVARFGAQGDPQVRYLPDPVDATELASAPAGLKTMINCFHHMRPAQARAILASAQRSRQPILVYELGDNALPFALWCVALPLALPLVAITALVLTPLVRPLTLRQLLLTYVIPLVPIFYAWDGQASVPRIYTFDDLDELLAGLESPGYRWEKGYATGERGRKVGTYLLGVPTE
ncbi:MAG: hypothetical protein KDK70_09435 [Myxococcales bacterium]|nr:hypothetical protein [Myxococcales bacterium]